MEKIISFPRPGEKNVCQNLFGTTSEGGGGSYKISFFLTKLLFFPEEILFFDEIIVFKDLAKFFIFFIFFSLYSIVEGVQKKQKKIFGIFQIEGGGSPRGQFPIKNVALK